MKAAILYEAGRPLEIEELETPAVADDDVLIKVIACGVCHTDLKVFGGHSPFTSPTILGHEVSGVIERIGVRQRSFFKEGDRVIVGMRYKCGRCRYCLAGRENLWADRPLPPSYKKKDGTPVTRWNVGGFAQYLAVPGYMVFSLPDQLPLEESSLIGCRVTTAYSAVKHSAELEPGDSSLVIGCGGIGLNTIQLLKCFGASPIIAADLIEEKLLAARKFGATHTINASKEDPVEATKSITDGGVDKSFEAIGNTKTADQIIRATRPGGTAVIIGGLGRVPFTISDGRFTMNEIKVTGVASRRTNDVIEVLRMVGEQRIEVESLVTKKYGFEDINEALEELRQGRLLMGISLWN
jgi:D-arabinose 1-dehydrogenase-like Zn-dependent alcohol dehydrogenase